MKREASETSSRAPSQLRMRRSASALDSSAIVDSGFVPDADLLIYMPIPVDQIKHELRKKYLNMTLPFYVLPPGQGRLLWSDLYSILLLNRDRLWPILPKILEYIPLKYL